MIEAILEILAYFLVEILFHFAILYPGAAIIWTIRGGRKRYKDIFENNRFSSAIAGFVLLFVILIMTYWTIRN
jgi:hypothetical protein